MVPFYDIKNYKLSFLENSTNQSPNEFPIGDIYPKNLQGTESPSRWKSIINLWGEYVDWLQVVLNIII